MLNNLFNNKFTAFSSLECRLSRFDRYTQQRAFQPAATHTHYLENQCIRGNSFLPVKSVFYNIVDSLHGCWVYKSVVPIARVMGEYFS